MYKKTMTFTDFNGNERTETFWFNLTEAEVVEMENGVSGGLTNMLENIVAAQDRTAIIDTFKNLILKAYGVKTADGRGFDKSPEVVKAFADTQAYSDLFMELSLDSKAASEFFNGILPMAKGRKPKNNTEVVTVVN